MDAFIKPQLAGLYLRLSREDEEKDGFSESIKNQQDFLIDYCAKNQLVAAEIYIDDGYSGTSFNRPAFMRMLEDIEKQKISVVLTKDLSRLGRDYILTGHYLERYFPERQIRYIAVNDGIDTMSDQSGNDMSPFRAVFNDMYAKDISKKVRTALRTKGEQGKFTGTFAPYGYRKDPRDKNHLLVETEEAFHVRRIFAWFLAGETIGRIAARLTEEEIQTPSEGKCQTAARCGKQWSYAMVRRILTMPTYQGDLVSHMSQRVSYKVSRVIRVPKEQWRLAGSTHEGIVSRTEFSRAQELLHIRSYTHAEQDGIPKPFTGVLFCADCGSPMVLWSNGKCRYFVCAAWKKAPRQKPCKPHYLREDVLSERMKQVLFEFLDKADRSRLHSIWSAVLPQDGAAVLEQQLLRKQKQTGQALLDVYRDRSTEAVSEREFCFLRDELRRENETLEVRLSSLRAEREKMAGEASPDLDSLLFFDGTLNRRLLLCLIERITVDENKALTVYLRFRREDT